MSLFLRRILYLFLPFFLLFCFIEYEVRMIPNSYKLKGEYLNNNANTIETLILGSSHTYYGVNPIFFRSKTFNASNVSQSPDVDLAILKSYENQFSNLTTLVIRLSYDTLFEQLKNSPEDWRLKDYKLYTDMNFDYTNKHNFELLSIGTRRSLKVLKDYYFNDKSLLNCDSLGWGNDLNTKSKTKLNKVGLLTAEKHTAKSWELLDDNIKIYNLLMAWCRNRNIQVILVTPPTYKSYRDNLNESQLKKMIQVGNDLNLRYSNCTYYNLIANEDFITEDFYDADHLNAIGAKKFSRIIDSIIEN